ncbi:MAG: RNA polymerase sigma-70 factor [Gemmatimonadota bacterium]|nr:MAG: RNA polymerase sigma-70 factor [Gemmatimonadota bacterium]
MAATPESAGAALGTATIEAVRVGDRDAFETFFHATYDLVCAVIASRVPDSSVVEELAQDVYLRIWRRHDRLRADGSLEGYAVRAARNTALNYLKRAGRERQWLRRQARRPAPSLPAADEPLILRELSCAVRDAMAELPTGCRTVFQLSRDGGLTYREIARTLGISVKTVEHQMGRALRLLRERLEPYLG